MEKELNQEYSIDRAQIIGFGQQGRQRILPALQKLDFIKSIVIYDILGPSDESKIYEKDNVDIVESMEEALKRADETTLVIISTTANARLKIFKQFVERGVKVLYLEKPLTQSLADAKEILNISRREKLKVAMGTYSNFWPLSKQIDQYIKDYKLGRLLKIYSFGGNAGISVNGIHFIDLAVELFKSDPIEVYGKILSRSENPRGDNFYNHGGFAHILFPEGREFILSYTNDSMIIFSVELTFEFGYINVDLGNEIIKIYGIDSSMRKQPKYKYQPIELLYEESFNYDIIYYLTTLFSVIAVENDEGGYRDIEKGYTVFNTLLGIFISDLSDSSLELPIKADNQYFSKQFPIT